MEMQTRRLGRTDLDISVIGLGAWAIGGPWKFGWGPQDDKESADTIRAAVERGVNWIDTAPAYGLGHSETIVGKTVRDFALEDRPYIFTKCSLVWQNNDNFVTNNLDPDSLRRELEDSLRRLDVDVIDLYQIHFPIPDQDIEAAWETVAGLRDQGKIRHIGVSNFTVEQLERVQALAAVETLQPPLSLLRRDFESTLPWCQEHDTGVIAYSPMGSGLLTGRMTRERVRDMPDDDWRKAQTDMLKEPKLGRTLALVDVMRDIGNNYGRSPGEVAIAWVLSHPAVTGAITGMRTREQTQIANAGTLTLSRKDMDTLNDFIQRNPVEGLHT